MQPKGCKTSHHVALPRLENLEILPVQKPRNHVVQLMSWNSVDIISCKTLSKSRWQNCSDAASYQGKPRSCCSNEAGKEHVFYQLSSPTGRCGIVFTCGSANGGTLHPSFLNAMAPVRPRPASDAARGARRQGPSRPPWNNSYTAGFDDWRQRIRSAR